MKDCSDNGDDWKKLNAQQLSIKKVVNTLYGVLASIYFHISSPCVANNITDRGRSGCWLMVVPFRGITSITDGTSSNINEVQYSPNKFPSLATIARLPFPDLLSKKIRSWNITAPLGSGGDRECAG